MLFPIHALVAAHYHSFQILVPFIAAYINPNTIRRSGFGEINPSIFQRWRFKRTKGYQQFIRAFFLIYALKGGDDRESRISTLLEKHSHPLELQVLLEPVLRYMFGDLLRARGDRRARREATDPLDPTVLTQ